MPQVAGSSLAASMPSARNPAPYAVVAAFMTDAACGIMLRKDAVHDVAVQGDVIFFVCARADFFPGGRPGAGHFSFSCAFPRGQPGSWSLFLLGQEK
jgi:hypothetical protein